MLELAAVPDIEVLILDADLELETKIALELELTPATELVVFLLAEVPEPAVVPSTEVLRTDALAYE
jgi:hypothetical protein